MNKIVLLVDFSPVSHLALEHVKLLAGMKKMDVILLHIAPSEHENAGNILNEKVKQFGDVLTASSIPFSVQLDYGNFFDVISGSIQKLKPDLVIVGTHGITVKGNFAGSDIVRLLNLMNVPALVIQLQSVTPALGYLKILLPVPVKTNDKEIVREVGDFAGVYNSSVHILGFYNDQTRDQMQICAKNIEEGLKESNSNIVMELEKAEAVVNSFSRSIIELADIEEAEVIVLMITSKFQGCFSADDQENILLNRLGKPVLCI